MMQLSVAKLQDLFNPDHNGDLGKTPMNFPIPRLSKLFMYGTYVKARAEAESIAVRDVVKGELDNYPYSRKAKFVDPHFTPPDIYNPNVDFKPAITDAGICHVLNGESLQSTVRGSSRNSQLMYSMDPRKTGIKPKMIDGTGKLSQMTFWLDARNKLDFGDTGRLNKYSLNSKI